MLHLQAHRGVIAHHATSTWITNDTQHTQRPSKPPSCDATRIIAARAARMGRQDHQQRIRSRRTTAQYTSYSSPFHCRPHTKHPAHHAHACLNSPSTKPYLDLGHHGCSSRCGIAFCIHCPSRHGGPTTCIHYLSRRGGPTTNPSSSPTTATKERGSRPCITTGARGRLCWTRRQLAVWHGQGSGWLDAAVRLHWHTC